MRYPHYFYIFFLAVILAHAQSDSLKYVEIKGTVCRKDSLTPVYGAAIYNKNKYLGTISNIKGNFKMKVSKGDTLLVTHVSYVPQYIIIHDTYNISSETIIVQLTDKTYQLATIDVRTLRGRRYVKKPFSLMRTDNVTYDLGYFMTEPLPYYYGPMPQQNYLGLIGRVGVGIWDPKEINRQQQLTKVAELEAIDRKKKYINLKYNRNTVSNLTGLKGNRLSSFLNFCKPSEKFIMTANDYELAYYILDCYDKFQQEED